jgi:hypothetical protein
MKSLLNHWAKSIEGKKNENTPRNKNGVFRNPSKIRNPGEAARPERVPNCPARACRVREASRSAPAVQTTLKFQKNHFAFLLNEQSPIFRGSYYCSSGSRTSKQVSPGFVAKRMLPRCLRTMRETASSPSPVPSLTPLVV